MTALAAPAPPELRRPAVPWARMIWVTWRQHRGALAAVLALLGGIGVFLLVTRISMRASYASLGLNNCRSVTSPQCAIQVSDFAGRYTWVGTFSLFLGAAPMLIGAFTGGPLLAREFESGTSRFAWSQGCGRLRWTLAKLVLVGVAVTVTALAFSQLYAWWYQPFVATDGRLESTAFEITNMVFAARALLGFAIGAFAGTLIRRTVPAVAAAMAGWLAIVLLARLYLRPRYQAPLVMSWSIGGEPGVQPRGWYLGQYVTGPGGHRISDATVAHLSSAQLQGGYRWVQLYQPESRFWHFQAIEGGWMLALAVLLGAATIWLVRRSAA